MEIRVANVSDAAGIAKVSAVLGYGQRGETDVAERLVAILGTESHKIWVCADDAMSEDIKIAGWIHAEKAVRVASEPFVDILGMAVGLEYQSRGIGSRLVNHVIGWAKALEVEVRVRTNHSRASTIEFYRNRGFSEAKTQKVLVHTIE